MPEHAKVKIRRKDLREPDEFQTLTTRAADWARRNTAIVTAAAAGVALVALVLLGVGWYSARRADAAAAEFRVAHTAFGAGKFAEAALAFATVEHDYGRTPFGRLAGLYRAHALARQGDAAAAVTAYQEYLATSPPADYLRQQALVGLGRAREAAGDTTGALDAFTQAGDLDGPFRTDALMAAARLQDATGHPAEAQAIYARLLKNAPDGDLKTLLLAKTSGSAAPAAGQPGQ